ncbi:MAG: efflux RND transporter periplasmic adaptor subunit [Elusimicrobia bacterium]|nr:efflux RND transporter periplasmic adaptor subunit [Elusimicrobiota bacterium]
MTTKRFAAGFVLGLLLLSSLAWMFWNGKAKNSRGPGRTVAVETGAIEDAVEATGTVTPLNRVEIKPPISGRVEKLLVEEGDQVKAGDIIAWMSSTDRAAILDAARAQGPETAKEWQDSYKPTPIVAPMTGVVILRNVVVGQTVDAGTVLYAMADSLIVLGQVDESDIGRIRVGMPVRVTLDAYLDRKTDGRVTDILYEGKNVSNVITYGVKVRLERTPAFFRSQMTANLTFIIQRKENALLIAASAVKEGPGGTKYVLIPGPEDKPVQREIATGLENGSKLEVISGLRAGEQVLLGRGRYVPQQGLQSSPLALGGRPGGGQQQGQGSRATRGR